jgi:hypothetical protein
MKRTALFLTLGFAFATSESAAFAAVVVVDNFTGAKKKEIRDAVVDALEKGDHEVVDAEAARVPPASSDEAYVKHATEYRTAAFVDGEVKQQKSGWVLTLTVRNGADGRELGEATLKGAKLQKLFKAIDQEAVIRLDPSIEQASAPEKKKKKAAEAAVVAKAEPEKEKEPEPEPEEPKDKQTKPPPEEHGRKPVPLELWGGMQVFSRSFEYHQDVNGSLHPYHLSLWPALEARLGYYPGAHFTRNMWANIGIVAGIAHSFGAQSAIGNREFGTTMQEIVAGARFRLPIAAHEIGASFTYGNHSFAIDSDHDPNNTAANGSLINRDYVPDPTYSYLRPGIDTRLKFGRFGVGAGLGLRALLGLGELTSNAWFPNATGMALDMFVSAAFEITPGFYAGVGFDAARYALDMHTKPADATAPRDVAGGAVDQYLTGRIGVEYRFGETRNGPEWRVSERERSTGSD